MYLPLRCQIALLLLVQIHFLVVNEARVEETNSPLTHSEFGPPPLSKIFLWSLIFLSVDCTYKFSFWQIRITALCFFFFLGSVPSSFAKSFRSPLRIPPALRAALDLASRGSRRKPRQFAGDVDDGGDGGDDDDDGGFSFNGRPGPDERAPVRPGKK